MAAGASRETHRRSFAKAVSWRIVGSIDTFLLSWLFTANVAAAGAIATTEMISKMALYYGHERLWSSFGWGMTNDSNEGEASA